MTVAVRSLWICLARKNPGNVSLNRFWHIR
jgi:hypothetical protein